MREIKKESKNLKIMITIRNILSILIKLIGFIFILISFIYILPGYFHLIFLDDVMYSDEILENPD
ncbi:MAG: hypothetical protein KIG88_11555, partial [Weeksellaceae bacterium]|nr:hypothetical protein [Weeksellaceae bacterium]